MTNYITPPPVTDGVALNLEVLVSEEDKSVYLKISGFENFKDAEEYSKYLGESLPLFLFESDTKH